jgi:membrane-bound metal-dependent hydrolase YbcI (DUF457 family)
MLIGAAAAEAVRPTRLPRVGVWMVGAVVALLPDIDIAIRIATGDYTPFERSATHSLVATALVALLAWIVAGRRWALVAGAAYASHLAADLLQDQQRTSVALLWPLQQRGMEPLLPLFPYVHVDRGRGVRSAARSLFEEPSFSAMLGETVIAAGVFLVVLVLSSGIRRLRSRGR